ncbi:unnamed protein product [Candida parapsilosis]
MGGGGTSSILSPSGVGATPHTSPYTMNAGVRTPSPKPPLSANASIAASLGSKNSSPSKMKALSGNHNPLCSL